VKQFIACADLSTVCFRFHSFVINFFLITEAYHTAVSARSIFEDLVALYDVLCLNEH
jgi:hypothetical protein